MTITEVWLHNNKIGDRGAVALAGAVRALLATVFFHVVHSLFLRFGLDNLLLVTLSRSFDVLENRAFGTRKKCKLCSVQAERARNLLSARWRSLHSWRSMFSVAVVSNEAAHVMSADQRYSCVNDGSPSPCVHAATAFVQVDNISVNPSFVLAKKLARRNNPNTCACWKEILRPW